MKLKSSTYDLFKWLIATVLPALQILLIGFSKLLDIPVLILVAGGVALVGEFLGSIILDSSKKYWEEKSVDE